MKRIRTLAQLELALTATTFLLFVHSAQSDTGGTAFREYEKWSARTPGTATGWIDADEHRLLAESAFASARVPHDLPRAIFLRKGRPSWTGAGTAITQASLGSAFGLPLPARDAGRPSAS